ncbi:MAG: type II toxin-antitoxin system mRNA interferase toxin, RelE/StbE family [Hydrogenophaga sp.]|uniref:type II toxin-antitoxin system RelE family toxin n=1 Tax=Hydrogenophaga sp. TaxID=1904254 RepID=UPI00169AC5FE|nr:type II toxin-antitoxin system RelE/ParE family toxin [Hydrogenophaga sp.]NIM41877.1 type II toxin-antitoxin system mRNA interferase toxin, RelE/StbE family [Hydrogenophaga sp.]NIN27182.1 type II toxin-antitoxin system mRNA interferase toxin, RelE/StbE family [Hydrogenophaga sp.]NIN31883.1 type II toxin-antitoxin system mRNA interferase toxin, RelE/StbE family [Hydrogenophaga sp.]NIN56127.1 type II toxin-antitoxin system mRNA interferase toxin, RelE/StbE family [Hydrogenophaga sp.]NIO52254.
MSYELRFHELALKEWRQLDGSVREPLKRKLAQRLEQPRVPAAALHGMRDCYKIKLKQVGYRLIYRVDDTIVTVMVLAVGRRDGEAAYRHAQERLP